VVVRESYGQPDDGVSDLRAATGTVANRKSLTHVKLPGSDSSQGANATARNGLIVLVPVQTLVGRTKNKNGEQKVNL
jgi:hypothetical protein